MDEETKPEPPKRDYRSMVRWKANREKASELELARALEQDRTLRAVAEWLDILNEVGYGSPTMADVDHSALLHRLLEGKDPLPEPPPRSMSYPWYELIEKGEDIADIHEFPPVEDGAEGGKFLAINQAVWDIVEKQDDDHYTVRWAATGLICKVEPLEFDNGPNFRHKVIVQEKEAAKNEQVD